MPRSDALEVHVRLEIEGDHEQVYSLVEAAFKRRTEAELVDALRRSAEPHVSLVAEAHDQIVGHVFFSPIRIESPVSAPPCCQLAPLAVLPKFHTQGVGSRLVREGLVQCKEAGWQAVFLVGAPAYYGRFGFEMAGPRGFTYPGPFDPHLQVIELEPGTLAGCSGRIHLHPAFAEVGAE